MSQKRIEAKNFEWVAKRILSSQKKLGTLKGLKINVLSLSDSRKKYLKQAGLYAVTGISGGAISGIAGYKKLQPKHKKAFIKGAVAGGLISTAVGTAAKDAGKLVHKKQNVVIEAKYKYGTKLFEVANLTQEQLENNIDKKILREVTAAVASLKTAKEWTVKESASVDYLNLAVLGEALIEDVLESQLLEDADVTVTATDAARNVSDFEDVEDDDEEVDEDFLFEDEDCEDSDDEEVDEDCKQSEEDDEDLAEAYVFEDEDCEDSDDEEVDEDFLFEEEDTEFSDEEDDEEVDEACKQSKKEEDDEEEVDEEFIFETDMFKF